MTRGEKLANEVWWKIHKWRNVMNCDDKEQIARESVELDRAIQYITRSRK